LTADGLKEFAVLEVRNPYSHEIIDTLPEPGLDDLERAIKSAEEAFEQMRALPAFQRSAMLAALRDRLAGEKEKIARLITREAGKPIRESRVEVERAILTLTIAAEEAKRLGGEVIPLDVAPAGAGRLGILRRFPIGPIAAVTPFNFPLNLVLHKVAPALASGNTVIVKPSPRTPLTALALEELAGGCGLPSGALKVLPGGAEMAQAMAAHPGLKMLTFTGSAPVGWALKQKAYRKKVTLELGGNSGVIVHSDADVDYAAQRIVAGAFAYAGQSCISVQRVLVQAEVYDQLLERLLPRARNLRVGDPLDEATDVGPMIDEAAAERAEAWVREAVDAGARVLAGGRRKGNFFHPTVLAETAPEMKVNCQEAFAPLLTVNLYEDFAEAVRRLNDSPYGLQAGVFTHDTRRIFDAFERIETGGVIINDVPTYRIDHMPYGGMKESGFGREGLRYAIEEMTEPKLLVLNLK
jgi:glyceraldehyde-3-phosphate dehydrogenase (NADP+)